MGKSSVKKPRGHSLPNTEITERGYPPYCLHKQQRIYNVAACSFLASNSQKTMSLHYLTISYLNHSIMKEFVHLSPTGLIFIKIQWELSIGER